MGAGESDTGGKMSADVFISLESNTIIPGGVLRGSIHVALYELLCSPSIFLSFKGKEITNFKMRQRSKENKNYKIHKGEHTLCTLTAQLTPWHNFQANPGNYSIPFDIKIFANLLPSFHTLSSNGDFCEIKYSVRAKLFSNNRDTYKLKIPISVFTNSLTLPHDIYPNTLEHSCTGRAGALCCFNKETTSARIWVEKGIFGYDDSIDINLETNLSEFSSNIARIEVNVKRVLTMVANKENKREFTQALTIYRENVGSEIKGQSEAQHFIYKIPVQEILKNEHCYTLCSELIKCQFVLNLRLFTDAYCYSFEEIAQGFVILPFQIQIPMAEPPISPEKWKPEVLSHFSIDSSTKEGIYLKIWKSFATTLEAEPVLPLE